MGEGGGGGLFDKQVDEQTGSGHKLDLVVGGVAGSP